MFFTDVMGVVSGLPNWSSIGKHTTNLQVPIDQDVTIGGYALKAGAVVNTGFPVAAQLNGLSAYQNSLAPPPRPEVPELVASVQRGAIMVEKANCAACHSGRYFINHGVIAEDETKGQPSRAKALSKFPQIFAPPETYSSNVTVSIDSPVLVVPTEISPASVPNLASAVGNPAGGYKVQSLIRLYLIKCVLPTRCRCR